MKIAAYLVAILLAVSIAAKALGSLLPDVDHPTLRGFTEGCEDKPQPCWYGIVPGQTTLDEAISVMDEMGYPINVAQRTDNNIFYRGIVKPNMTVGFDHVYNPYSKADMIMDIYLRDLGNLQLIDVLDHFGMPTYIELYRLGDYLEYPPYMIITLYGLYDSRLSQSISGFELSSQYPPLQGLEWQAHLRRNDYCVIQMSEGGIPCT